MGICLDTEQNQSHGPDARDGHGGGGGAGGELWPQDAVSGELRYASTPPDGHFPMHNGGKVHFEQPRVPVIFVLGGPGSGKVTHCDNLMQEKKGIVHINMTDLLQQYAIGNDMQDFSQLSSRTVTEVLMLEMKMAPNAKTYLVSGYPRSMRDVVEYSDKIQVVNGAILISWRQKVLERQIDYGAKLGQVVLSLARMELNNFFKNVMPVADYFDQSNMLIAVNGERHPGDVYKDFRAAVMKILGQQDNPPVFAAGRVAAVPSDVSTEQQPRTLLSNGLTTATAMSGLGVPQQGPYAALKQPAPGGDVITVTSREMQPALTSPVKPAWPPVLWVVGGPGSGKAALCQTAAGQNPGWAHVSVGRLLRAAAAGSQDAREVTVSFHRGFLVLNPPPAGGEVFTVTSREMQPALTSPVKPAWPPVLWVVGGPGSGKAALCQTAAGQNPGWAHVSVGRLLRAAAAGSQDAREGDSQPNTDTARVIKNAIVDGELAPLDIVLSLVESHMAANLNKPGIILDGFPRNMQQVQEFEKQFKQQPTLILLDCSKLQLGRGRLDDSVSAFRRRLEIFREHSLPMLKAMDNVGRLTIVDGDTDTVPVQDDFYNVVKQHLQFLKDFKLTNQPPHLNNLLPSNNAVLNGVNNIHKAPQNSHGLARANQNHNGHIPNGHARDNTTLTDLEAVTELETISKRVQGNIQNGVNHLNNRNGNVVNGRVGNGIANGVANGVANGFANGVANGVANGNVGNGLMNGHAPNGTAIGNGFVPDKYRDLDQQRRENIRNMYQGVPIDSHI